MPASACPRCHLDREVERRAGDAALIIRRHRPGDWDVTIFRDADRIDNVDYFTGHGDTEQDAKANLLAKMEGIRVT